MKPVHVALGSAILTAALGCGPRTFDLAPSSAQNAVKDAPEWMIEVPRHDNHLVASATATSRDFQVAIEKARTLAETDIARQLGAHVSSLTRQFQEEAGLGADSQLLTEFLSVTKAVVDENLVGARVAERKLITEGNIYRAYVLMQLPVGDANRALMQNLRASKTLFVRLRATQAYADLENELRHSRTTASD